MRCFPEGEIWAKSRIAGVVRCVARFHLAEINVWFAAQIAGLRIVKNGARSATFCTTFRHI